MKINWIHFLICFIFTNLFIIPFILSLPENNEIKEVPCYDRFNNEIKDLKCEKEIMGISINMKIFLSLYTLIFSMILSSVVNIRRNNE